MRSRILIYGVPRNESGDYTVFLTAYTRRLGDNICFGIACIKTAPFTCSIAIVIAWRFFSANSAAVLTFSIRICYKFMVPAASVSMLSHTICDVPVMAWLYASGLSPFRLKCGNYILIDFSILRKPFSCFLPTDFIDEPYLSGDNLKFDSSP